MADHIKIPVENILSSKYGLESVSFLGVQFNDLFNAVSSTTSIKRSAILLFVFLKESSKLWIASGIKIVSIGEYLLDGSKAKVRYLRNLRCMLAYVFFVDFNVCDIGIFLSDILLVNSWQSLGVAFPPLHHHSVVVLPLLNNFRIRVPAGVFVRSHG